jgi:hypothetical protein
MTLCTRRWIVERKVDQARAVVDKVVTLITEHEQNAGSRTNRRNKKIADLRLVVQGFLADLFRAQATPTSHGYVYRAMRPGNFSAGAIGYRVFKAVADGMAAARLLETYRGWQSWSDGFGARVPMISKATRFRATQRLHDIKVQTH